MDHLSFNKQITYNIRTLLILNQIQKSAVFLRAESEVMVQHIDSFFLRQKSKTFTSRNTRIVYVYN